MNYYKTEKKKKEEEMANRGHSWSENSLSMWPINKKKYDDHDISCAEDVVTSSFPLIRNLNRAIAIPLHSVDNYTVCIVNYILRSHEYGLVSFVCQYSRPVLL